MDSTGALPLSKVLNLYELYFYYLSEAELLNQGSGFQDPNNGVTESTVKVFKTLCCHCQHHNITPVESWTVWRRNQPLPLFSRP